MTRCTTRQRASPLREIGESYKTFIKPITPQAPLANTRGNQVSGTMRENPKQLYKSGYHNGLGYIQPRVNTRPLLPTPNMRLTNPYNQRSSLQNYQRRNFYQRTSHYQSNNYQRRDNSYPNQTFFRPQGYNNYRSSYQSQNNFQNNPWSAFSSFGIEKLCVLLQDPRMFNLGTLNANQNGPKKQWVPRA